MVTGPGTSGVGYVIMAFSLSHWYESATIGWAGMHDKVGFYHVYTLGAIAHSAPGAILIEVRSQHSGIERADGPSCGDIAQLNPGMPAPNAIGAKSPIGMK